jgi:hypothetical protein
MPDSLRRIKKVVSVKFKEQKGRIEEYFLA